LPDNPRDLDSPDVDALMRLVRGLLLRPAITDRPPNQVERGDQPLPLVWLTGAHESAQRFLRSLEEQLAEEQQPRIVHALVDVTAAPPSAPPETDESPAALLPLLDRLARELSADRFGSGRLTRFDFYRLASWLARQHLDVPDRKNDRADIVRKLREWSGRSAGPELGEVSGELPPGYTRLGLRLVSVAGKVFQFRWIRERIPGIRREARWFMRHQSYMIPKHSIDFIGFAERLTIDRRGSESAEQLKKLLVHSFLEDLRRAYRRGHDRLPVRRAGWRRTTYVAALLNNVTESNEGGELLRLINEVRNETGELDPLLVIAASDEHPRAASETVDQLASAAHAGNALAQWRRNLPSRRQRLTDDARYLVLEISPDRPPSRDGVDPGDQVSFRPPKANPLVRRGVLEVVLVIALVALLSSPVTSAADAWFGDCLNLSFTDTVSVSLVEVAPGDEQCIGYSDSSAVVFGATARLRHAEEAVFAQNEIAEDAHAADPNRPYVSVVYFAGLTHRDANIDTDDALAEDIEGILLRQQEQNTKSRSQPLLRVIIANGGEEMKKADHVTHEFLAPLVAEDDSIMGIVGFDRTVVETERAIKELGTLGVPTIGTPLTGTGLVDRSELYFQVVPTNGKQAELVARYANAVNANSVLLYHPPLGPRDTYIRTLDQELERHLDGRAVVDRPWVESAGDLDSLCEGGEDHRRDMVFYAAREEEFGDFLRAITAGCQYEELPEIVASDAISRFVAQRSNRNQSQFAGIRISYVSMGSLVALAGKSCAGGASTSEAGGKTLRAFCDGYHSLLDDLNHTLQPTDRPAAPWPGERIGLTYDATGVLVDAVRQIRRRSDVAFPHRAAVAQQLREMTFTGVTGLIDFRSSRIGDDRSLAILTVADIHNADSAPTCAFLIGALYEPDQPREATGCPVPGG
jgi:hypothetical protein